VTPGPVGGYGRDSGDDLVELGRDRPAGGRWRARVLLACLGLTAAIAIAVQAAGHHARPRPSTTPSPLPQVLVTVIGHRLLGQTAAWQLFARGPDDLLRIQFAQGRVTRTYVPPLASSNVVALVIGAHEAVIRSADFVPAYVVPDGAKARVLTGPLAGGGPLIPGPPGSQAAWVNSGSRASPALSLITLTGRRSGPVIRFPHGGPQLAETAVSDGRGDVLVATGTFAVYDAGPGWDRRLPGAIIATGPDGWLAVTCRARFRHCRNEVVDAADRTGRILPGQAETEPYYFSWPPIGVIAPDRDTAAVADNGSGGTLAVRLINLRTGTTTDLDVRIGAPGGSQAPDGAQQSMAWSPDSRWLFVAAAGGHLVVIDARTGRAEPLGISLPVVDQVAVRP
jgi:hypothetical protein